MIWLTIKNSFVVFCFLFQFLMVWSINVSLRNKTVLNKTLSYLAICALVSVLVFLGNLLTPPEHYKSAIFYNALYYISIDWLLLFMLNFVESLSRRKYTTRFLKIVKLLYVIVCSIDSFILLINVFTGFVFSMDPLYVNQEFYCWIGNFKPYFTVHLIICYFMTVVILAELIYEIRIVSKIYKIQCWVNLVGFILVVLANGLFLMFTNRLKIDYSVIIYEVFSVFSCFYCLKRGPKQIENQLLSIVSQNVSNPVMCFDYKGLCIYKNNQIEDLFRTEGFEEWTRSFFTEESDFVKREEILSILNENNELEERYYVVEFSRVRSKKNTVEWSYLKLEDVTLAKRNLNKIEFRASHDDLTGLLNRNAFFEKARKVISESPDIPRYMICTNIKRFKLVNELFGPQFGDNLLRQQAEMLKAANYTGRNIIGRISGDKFAMLIEKSTFNEKLAIENTKSIRDIAKGINFTLQICIGVYEILNPNEKIHIMYDKAMMAIRDIDDKYSDVVLNYYDSSMMRSLLNEKRIIDEFKHVLSGNQFEMYLQAQIDSQTGKCVGAEALSRWYDGMGNIRNPDTYVSILERTGLVYELDHSIWIKAVRKLQEWKNRGYEDMYISINISAKDFFYADVYKVLTNLVEEYDVNPKRLNLEITETTLITNTYNEVISRLQEYGFNIEMDDFGSCYSSLNALRDIKVDVLKIDMEFLRENDHPEKSEYIIASVIKMAKKLGMTVITEGVENQHQVDFLKQAGSDYLQGYFYSKPVTVIDFESQFMKGAKSSATKEEI